METKEVIATIKLIPLSPGRVRINVQMPFWLKKDEPNNKIYINIALLGGLTTFVEKESDIDTAITEALQCFFDSCQKHGSGIKKELMDLGWQLKPTSLRYRVSRPRRDQNFNLPNISPAYTHAMRTGVSKSLSLQV